MVGCCFLTLHPAFAFEGWITAAMTRGGRAAPLLYTVGTNFLRVEMTATNAPNPIDILDLNSGQLTLLFPNNRSFVRLSNEGAHDAPQAMPMNAVPSLSAPPPAGNIGPTNLLGIPASPPIPMIPPSMMEKLLLTAMGDKTNLLGFACAKYEIKERGETMEIWATDKLLPFERYVQNQPQRFGPRMIEEQWAGLLKFSKLFPLMATLKLPNGVERYRFEIKNIEPGKVEDKDGSLSQPPTDYHEIQPLPF